ncbi:sulfotransferase 1E1-like [Mytilus edulis]|uniref:sulfotransferase 1E1-like n=1 Tax=Mytilus edulis TaxID=6550 RepID=UPI0039F0AA25
MVYFHFWYKTMGDKTLDGNTSSEWKPELKYDFDPITSEDEIVTVDLGGTPIQCLKIGDALQNLKTAKLFPDYRKHIPSIRNMEMDDDDVIICAFAKSGTHWLWEMASMLGIGKADYHGKEKTSAMFEFIPAEALRVSPKPRIYNTHFAPQCLPKQAFDKKCKILFLQRNPKDVLVSLLPFLQGYNFIDSTIKWDEFISKYMELEVESSLLNWFYYTRQWYEFLKEGHDNIYCLSYEDMKDDPVTEISKLAKFLEVEANSELAKDIAVKCSFQNMKQAASSKQETFAINNKELAKKITNFTYRKGEVGDWKNYFTVAVNEKFNARFAKKMKGIDFKYRFSL